MQPSIDYPTAAGQWRVQGGTLTCRLPGRAVTVRAPGALLRSLQVLCDGRLGWREVAAHLHLRWAQPHVAPLLQGLVDQGLLVDRTDREVLQSPSHRTFADAPVRAEHLRAVLQQVLAHARGTGIRWQVEVLQPLPQDNGQELPAGLYIPAVAADGTMVVRRLRHGAGQSWQRVPDPRLLRFASAVLLAREGKAAPGGAVRALCAGQRRAADLGFGHALVQGLVPPPAPAGSAAPRNALPALVLGTACSPAEAAARHSDDWLTIRSLATAIGAPGSRHPFAFTAGPFREGRLTMTTVGRAADPRLALRKAEAEAWERLGWARLGPTVDGPVRDIAGARDPGAVVAYADWQHGHPGFPFARFHPRRPSLWCQGFDAVTGAQVRLPAECVHALDALPARWRRSACTSSSTSGVAAGPDQATAFAWALLELVERDAFLRAWVTGRAAPVVASAALPADALRRVRALRAASHRVVVLRLPALAPVYAVYVQAVQRPFTVVTASAHFDPGQALHKALDEAQGCAMHAATRPVQPLQRPSTVRSLAQLHRYWQSPGTQRQADFLVGGPPEAAFAPPGPCSDGPQLLAALVAGGLRPLAFDLTPPGAAADQGRTPLRVVRAVVPGLLPIWFAHGLEPAGLPAFARLASHGNRPVPLHPFP